MQDTFTLDVLVYTEITHHFNDPSLFALQNNADEAMSSEFVDAFVRYCDAMYSTGDNSDNLVVSHDNKPQCSGY